MKWQPAAAELNLALSVETEGHSQPGSVLKKKKKMLTMVLLSSEYLMEKEGEVVKFISLLFSIFDDTVSEHSLGK